MKNKNLHKISRLSDNLSAMLAHLYDNNFLMLSIAFCVIINTCNVNAQCPIPPKPSTSSSYIFDDRATLSLLPTWPVIYSNSNYLLGFHAWYKKSVGSSSWTADARNTITNLIQDDEVTIPHSSQLPLEPNTSYDFRVKSQCYNTGWSDYSPILTFTTKATSQQCLPPALSSIKYTYQSGFGTISYTAVANTSYKICWTETGISGTGGCMDDANTDAFGSISFPSLKQSTFYTVKIQSTANCGTSTTAWSQGYEFLSSPNTCKTPYGLNKSSFTFNTTTFNTASLSFIIPSNATYAGYVVTYKDGVTGVSKDVTYDYPGATTAATVTKSFLLPGLLSSRNYSFTVKLKCGTSFSNLSSSYPFTTPIGPCNVPLKPVISSKNNISATFSVTIPANSNYTGYIVEYKNLNTGFYGYKTYTYTGLALSYSKTINVILPGLLSSKSYQCAVRLKCSNCNSSLSPWSDSFTTNANMTPNPNDEITADSIKNVMSPDEHIYVEDQTEEIIALEAGDEALSIKNESIENQSIIPFPNPIMAGEELQIDGVSEGAAVSIYSLDGKLVINKILSDENQKKIKIPSDLPAAIYMIKLTTISGDVLFKKLAVTITN